MARYRFRWDNVPGDVLEAVGRALRLDEPVAEALRRRYGARPKESFVADAWTVLLETWLPRDDAARGSIARQLAARSLGTLPASLDSAQSQLGYLRSCRNATTLRQIVLAAFIAAGEPAAPPVPRTRPTPTGTPGPRINNSTQMEEQPGQSLAEWVDKTLASLVGVKHVTHDDDGDVPIRHGSTVCHVRVRVYDDRPPQVVLFAPLVTDIDESAELYRALNEVNLQLAFGRIVYSDRQITLQTDLIADTLSAAELQWTLEMLQSAADYYDDKLVLRFGGRTIFDTEDEGVEV